MASSRRGALDGFVGDLRAIFQDRLQAVVLYGAHVEQAAAADPMTCLVVVASLDVEDLDACAREQGRVERGVVGAVVAVASGALGVGHDDVLLAHAEHLGEVLAQPEDALAVRPDLKVVAPPSR